MKYVVIGDLHCDSTWKQIVQVESDVDKIIFLGDYTCPRKIKFEDSTDVCGFLYEVLDFKDKNPDKVILLRGNHDICSLGYRWARCSPQDHPYVLKYWQSKDVKNWYLSNTQWIYQIPNTNIICSHAGCSEQFLDNAYKVLKQKGIEYYTGMLASYSWIISQLNNIEPCELFGFTPCKLSDYCGTSATQPCTWIRPYTLLEYGVKDFIHIVGHTVVEHICNIKEESLKINPGEVFDMPNIEDMKNYVDVWACDCLKNKEYLVIEVDNKNIQFKPKSIK